MEGTAGRDLLVCAGRRGGLGVTQVEWGETSHHLRYALFDGTDIVDVCRLDPDPRSSAIAALGRDGSLFFVRNALNELERVSTVKFRSVTGTAYRVLRGSNDVFVLTSAGLFVLSDLVRRFIERPTEEEVNTDILALPMDAVDFSIVNDRWLLLVMPDEVLKGDLEEIRRAKPGSAGTTRLSEPARARPSTVNVRARDLALA
jgi:hypothetical protein